jgi:hypothetical protein
MESLLKGGQRLHGALAVHPIQVSAIHIKYLGGNPKQCDGWRKTQLLIDRVLRLQEADYRLLLIEQTAQFRYRESPVEAGYVEAGY